MVLNFWFINIINGNFEFMFLNSHWILYTKNVLTIQYDILMQHCIKSNWQDG